MTSKICRATAESRRCQSECASAGTGSAWPRTAPRRWARWVGWLCCCRWSSSSCSVSFTQRRSRRRRRGLRNKPVQIVAQPDASWPVISSPFASDASSVLFDRLVGGLPVCDEEREAGSGGRGRHWRNPAHIQHRGPRRRSGKGNTRSSTCPPPTPASLFDFSRCACRIPASSPFPPLEATLEAKAH